MNKESPHSFHYKIETFNLNRFKFLVESQGVHTSELIVQESCTSGILPGVCLVEA